MSLRQAKRLEAIGRVTEGLWTMAVAAAATGLSVRQLRRLCRKVEAQGATGLLHGNQGKKPVNKHVGNNEEGRRARAKEVRRLQRPPSDGEAR